MIHNDKKDDQATSELILRMCVVNASYRLAD